MRQGGHATCVQLLVRGAVHESTNQKWTLWGQTMESCLRLRAYFLDHGNVAVAKTYLDKDAPAQNTRECERALRCCDHAWLRR